MKQPTAVHIRENIRILSPSRLLPHAVVRDELRPPSDPAPHDPGSRFSHEFSQTVVRSAEPLVGQNYATASCPIFPQRCPFGGACHTCPARVQTKLKIGQPGDKYEQEADRVAEQVMRMPEPELWEEAEVSGQMSNMRIQRVWMKRENQLRCQPLDEGETLQAKEIRDQLPVVSPGLEGQINSLQGRGQPLPEPIRAFFEPRFGHDFSQVQIHTDNSASETARALRAQAFTIGRNIVFGKGQDALETKKGRRLLAHELTHTLQQKSVPKQTHPTTFERSNLTGISADVGDLLETTSSSRLIQLTPCPAPDVPLNFANIITAIKFRSSSRPLAPDRGWIAFAATRPTGSGPDGVGSGKVPTDRSLPVNAFFFPAGIDTNQRALIIGGFHGNEHPGYEMADDLCNELLGARTSGSVLAFHLLMIPRVNPGGIADGTRCNRQLVDLNQNFPVTGIVPAGSRSTCSNTLEAPIQPEVLGVINAMREFQPNRVLSAHAIQRTRSAGIFVDPNYPTPQLGMSAIALACDMANLLPRDLRLRNLDAARDTPLVEYIRSSSPEFYEFIRRRRCVPLYRHDLYGALPTGRSLGAYVPTYFPNVPVITVEAPTYRSLARRPGRVRRAYLQTLRRFVITSSSLPSEQIRRKEVRSHNNCTEAKPASTHIQSSAITSGIETNPLATMRGGQPLSRSLRRFFKPWFGDNVEQVRIHTDSHAAKYAEAMEARAFTIKRDIFFGKGQYTPDSVIGRRLLAHELTHVIQQNQLRPQIQRHGVHSGLSPAGRYQHTLQHAHVSRSAWDRGYLRSATFLGVRIQNGIHQKLKDRLELAENHLRREYAAEGLSDAQIAARIGLHSIHGKRPPSLATGGRNISFHSFGLAIDVNRRENIYIAHSPEEGQIVERATALIGGRLIDVRDPGGLTLEQLHYRYHQAALELYEYVLLRNNHRGIEETLIAAGMPPDSAYVDELLSQIQQDYRDLRRRNPGWDPARRGFIDLSLKLVEALCDVAGLHWGGQLRGGADLMHFDFRSGALRPGHRV